MAPVRKKSKLSNDTDMAPAQEQQVPPPPPAPCTESGSSTATATQEETPSTLSHPDTTAKHPAPVQGRNSWYSASSWRTKASPVAQVARHSISVDKGVSSESSDQDHARRRPSQSVSKSFKGGSRKSVPLLAEPTRVHATSKVSQPLKQTQQKSSTSPSEEKATVQQTPQGVESRNEVDTAAEEALPQPTDVDTGEGNSKAETASLNVKPASASWFGWWSRPDGYGSDTEKIKGVTYAKLDGAAEHVNEESHASEVPTVSAAEDTQQGLSSSTEPQEQRKAETGVTAGSGRSWFGLWSSTQNEQAAEEDRQRRQSEQAPNPMQGVPAEMSNQQDVTTDIPKTTETVIATESKQEPERHQSSGWAFWSRDRSKDIEQSGNTAHKEVGELAVADTPSQSHPEAAQFNQEREGNKVDASEVKRSRSLIRMKPGRAERSNNLSGQTTAAVTPSESQMQTPIASQLQTPRETPEGSPAPVQRGKNPQTRPNLVLPSFRDTYTSAATQGVIERLTHYIAQSLHIPGYDAAKPQQYPHINPAPPKVKKAIAIGVHGYFPAALLQRVIGQPTGTSIRFANYAAASIKQWCHEHQPSVKDVEVEKVALEGEGFIFDRVMILWKLLLNWLSHLRQADFILVACHSQGVPVAIMLVAKLIQLGCLNPNVRLGLCAMAGVNLGPFSEYKSRFFGGTALELFDFSDTNSKVSIAYAEAIDICLRHGVRLTFTGSIDDQLVSLESSLHVPLNHPYVSRAVFIDGRLHTSNFLTHLVVFALKLRNLGVSDHGLIRELSGPLAGSLVGGEGHSRVYDDPAVYQNAIEFALESTDMSASAFVVPTSQDERRKSAEMATQRRASLAGYPTNMNAANSMRRGSLSSLSLAAPGIAPVMSPYEAPGAAGTAEKNPYVLPWAVRGMLSEDLVKRDPELRLEVQELVKEFEAWKPTSKVLKDVRWRLEGVRSML